MVSRSFQAPAFTRATPLVLGGTPPLHVVSGRWRGWWVVPGRATAVGVNLSQSGNTVSGILSLGPHLNNRVRGAIDDHGFLRFEGTDVAAGGRTSFDTEGIGLALGEEGLRLEGFVRSKGPGVGPGPSDRLVTTVGLMTLRKVV